MSPANWMSGGRAETSRSRYGHALDDNQVRRPLPRFTQDFVRLALAENGLDPAIDGRYCRANSCSCCRVAATVALWLGVACYVVALLLARQLARPA